MRLDFYYFSYQCPLNDSMLLLLDGYRDKIDIHLYDISKNPRLAKQQKIFFPTLTVLDGIKRYYSPIRKSFLEQAVLGIYPIEKPYLPKLGRNTVTKRLTPLNFNHVVNACACCGNPTESNYTKKAFFLSTTKQTIYGFIHRDESNLLIGGAEYLSSEIVPYDIPHDKSIAFLTCLYLSDPDYDYKTAPLKALEAYLAGQYREIIAISDEIGIFPNGDLEFFLKNEYHDQGIIYEDENYCQLHLVSKRLSAQS